MTMIGKSKLTSTVGELFIFIKSSIYKDFYGEILAITGIKPEIDVIQALIDEYAYVEETRTVSVAMTMLQETITKIHDELRKLQLVLEKHKTKFFSKWRGLNYQAITNNLKQYAAMLEKNRKLFISVLNVSPSEKPTIPIESPRLRQLTLTSFIDRLREM